MYVYTFSNSFIGSYTKMKASYYKLQLEVLLVNPSCMLYSTVNSLGNTCNIRRKRLNERCSEILNSSYIIVKYGGAPFCQFVIIRRALHTSFY